MPEDLRPYRSLSRGQNIVPMERAIEATTTVSAAHARARTILMDDPGAVLCETCSAEDRRAWRFLAQLAVDIGGGASVDKRSRSASEHQAPTLGSRCR